MPFKTLAGLRRDWRWFTEIWRDIRGVPFVIGLMALVGLLLDGTPQGADIAQSASDWSAGFNVDTLGLLLSAFWLGLQAWYWTRFIIDEDATKKFHKANPGATTRARSDAVLLEWLPRALGFAPFVFAAAAIAISNDGWTYPILAVAGAGVAFFVALVFRRPAIAKIKQAGNGALLSEQALAKFSRIFRWSSAGFALAAFLAALFVPVPAAQAVGPIGVVYIGVATIITMIAWALYATRSSRLPVLGGLIVLAIVSTLSNDNHAIGRRWMTTPFDAPISGRLALNDAFDLWLKDQPPTPDPIPIVFVSAEGGASRAGYWAADTLGRLQDDTGGDFSKHVFAISSVSGGSVGSTAFVSQLALDPKPAGGFRKTITDASSDDFLSPALAGLFFPDLLQRFLPLPVLPDRAETLEHGFEQGWRRHCPTGASKACTEMWTESYLDIWKNQTQKDHWIPLLLVNGTRQEDGARIITSDVKIDPNDFPNTVDFLEVNGSDIRVSTAILNGARFPLVSPGGTIHQDSTTAGHILDGGYYDGGGVATMRDTAVAVLRIAAARGLKLKPIFVEINNDTDTKREGIALQRTPYESARAQCHLGRSPTHNFLVDILGPLEGLKNAGGARGTTGDVTLALDIDAQNAAADRAATVKPQPGVTVAGPADTVVALGQQPRYHLLHLCDLKSEKGRVPMDWVLSKSAQANADNGLVADQCGNDPVFKQIEADIVAAKAPPKPQNTGR